MTAEERPSLDEILQRALTEFDAGEVSQLYDGEVELHTPMPRTHREPLEVDPDTEALLRALLGPKTVE